MISNDQRLVCIPAEHVMQMTVQNIQAALDNNKFPVQAVMQRLQQLGYSWAFMNKNRKNLLHFAAEEGDCQAIKMLLDARIFHVNDFEYSLFQGQQCPNLTALNYASREDHFEAVKLLVSYCADTNIRAQTNTPVIMDSIQAEGTEIFEYLLELGSSPKDVDRFGRNCLDQAAAKGNVALLERLLTMGFDLNQKSAVFKMTILHEACKNGKSTAMIKKLMDLGLNPLEPCFTYDRPTDLLIMYGTRETLSLMISYGVDVIAAGPRGENGLHYACMESNLDTAQLLIEKGANVNQPTSFEGKLPIMIAVEQSCPTMIELLKSLGANVNVRTPDGDSLIMFAVKKNNLVVIECLLRAGCNPNEPIPSLVSPLQVACVNRNIPLIHKLIDYGADVNAADEKEGWTVLHKMCIAGRADIVFALLQRGANADAKDKRYYSPLDFTRDEMIQKMLIEKGSNRISCLLQFYKCFVCWFCCQCFSDERM